MRDDDYDEMVEALAPMLTVREFCNRVHRAQTQIRCEGGDVRGWKVAVNPADLAQLERESWQHDELWTVFEPVRYEDTVRKTPATIFGMPIEASLGLKPGQIRLQREVEA